MKKSKAEKEKRKRTRDKRREKRIADQADRNAALEGSGKGLVWPEGRGWFARQAAYSFPSVPENGYVFSSEKKCSFCGEEKNCITHVTVFANEYFNDESAEDEEFFVCGECVESSSDDRIRLYIEHKTCCLCRKEKECLLLDVYEIVDENTWTEDSTWVCGSCISTRWQRPEHNPSKMGQRRAYL